MELNRRSLITGLACLIAAPAIVRVTSIMPVRAYTAEIIHPIVEFPYTVVDVFSIQVRTMVEEICGVFQLHPDLIYRGTEIEAEVPIRDVMLLEPGDRVNLRFRGEVSKPSILVTSCEWGRDKAKIRGYL